MKIIDKISQGFTGLSGLAVIVAMVHVVVDVSMRYTGGHLRGTIEIISYVWMPVIVFLAMGGAYLAGEHLRATLLTDVLDGIWKKVAEIVAGVAFFLVSAVLAYYLWQEGLHALDIGEANMSAGIAVPVWPARLAAAVGFSVMTLQTLVGLIRTFSGIDRIEQISATSEDLVSEES